ncbi:outer membrane protein assembly factor BamB family protein, partial [Streptomyces boluensis]
MFAQLTRVRRYAGCGILLALGLPLLLAGDGRTATEPLERPNTLDVAWSFRTDGSALDTADRPALADGTMLAVPQGRKVTVVDTRTGRRLSQLHSTADELVPLGFSDGVLLAVQERSSANTLTAYDPATGRKLWQRTKSPLARGGEDRDWLRIAPFLPETGPVVDAADGWLAGLAPRTGAVRWSVQPPSLTACPPPGPD